MLERGIGGAMETSRYRTHVLFLSIYIFLSGFVFIEPSPAEWWFTLSLPFLLLNFRTTWTIISTTLSLLTPLVVSTFFGLISLGAFNVRFVIIDLYLFAFFFVLASYATSLKRHAHPVETLNFLMVSWSFAGAINIIASIIGYFTGGLTLLKFNRLTGFFKDPNVLGPFLVPVAIYFLMCFFKEHERRLFNLFMFLFFSLGVLLTFSRAAWLNYVVSMTLIVLLVFRNRGARVKVLTLIIILPIVFLMFWSIADEIKYFNTTLKDFLIARFRFQAYDETRFENQRKFIEILSSSEAFFGIGPGNYEQFTGMATHSLYIRYITERGFFGFLLFLAFWAFIIGKAFSSVNRDFLLPVLLGQLANSFFIDSLHWRHLWLIISFVFLG